MSLHIYETLEQRSPEWYAARCGIVTASTVGRLITASTLKLADNETARRLTAQLVAERITGHVEETFQSHSMFMGVLNEPIARDLYAEHHAPVQEVGFMVREIDLRSRLGYSPDGLVGDDGLIEIKSRDPHVQLSTILADDVPAENMAQLQCGLLVSGRSWIDYVSYSGGLPLYTKRVYPSSEWHQAIVNALAAFEVSAESMIEQYERAVVGLPMTERIDWDAAPELKL